LIMPPRPVPAPGRERRAGPVKSPEAATTITWRWENGFGARIVPAAKARPTRKAS